MSSSREQSPDWLRSFQVPRHSAPTVSSDPEPFPSDNSSEDDSADCDKLPISEVLRLSNKDRNRDAAVDGSAAESSKKFSKAKSPLELSGKGDTPSNSKIQKRKGGDKTVAKASFQGSADKEAQNFSAYTISSDSESCRITDAKNEDSTYLEETSDCKASQSQNGVKEEDGRLPDTGRDSPPKKMYRRKYLKQAAKIEDIEEKTDIEEMKVSGNPVDIAEEERERHQRPHASSSRLPLVLSEKVHRTKALVECEGDSIDLSGDMGAVGRVVISDTPSGNHEMYLDLKGTIYRTTILPCRTFCVVSFGQSEAKSTSGIRESTFPVITFHFEKIEAIMSDYMQLSPQSDFNEAETVVEGTLEGFSLALDDDADGMPKSFPDQNGENDGNGEKTSVKKKKKADKASGLSEKRGRKAGSKPDAKVSKKTRVSKKPTTKK